MPEHIVCRDNERAVRPHAACLCIRSGMLHLIFLSLVSAWMANAASADTTPATVSGEFIAATPLTPVRPPPLPGTSIRERHLEHDRSDGVRDIAPVQLIANDTTMPGRSSGYRSDFAEDGLWDLLNKRQHLTVPDNAQVRRHMRQYRAETRWLAGIFKRAAPYAGYIVDELAARNMPLELFLVPAIETGYRPDAVSKKGAAGLWQLMPQTASDRGVSNTQWRDGRFDLRESTRAALIFLKGVNREFNGDWVLTLAAYNAGPGRVRRAIEKNRLQGLGTDFWSLKLPKETKDYVPRFFALLALIRDWPDSRWELPDITTGRGFAVITQNARTRVEDFARTHGLPEDIMRSMNASLRFGVTPPSGPHVLYIPANHDSLFPGMHRVRAGDSLSLLSSRYGVDVERLMEINKLTDTTIRIGQTLKLQEFPE